MTARNQIGLPRSVRKDKKMPKFIVRWNAGYGDEYEEVEAENEDAATKLAYANWKDDIESNASYSTVGLSTYLQKKDYGL